MEFVVMNIVLPLLLGFAGSVLARLVGREYSVSVGIGAVLAVAAAAAGLQLPPYRVVAADWCLKGGGAVRIEGTLGTLVFGSPVANHSVQLKVYEAGHGDPPIAGPETVTTDSHGAFRGELSAPPSSPGRSYVINVVYFYDSLLGEQWRKRDFKRGNPPACPA